MFERFSKQTVLTVHATVAYAQQRDADHVDEEHLAHALFREPGTLACQLTNGTVDADSLERTFGAAQRRGGISAAEATNLRQLGVDVDELVSSVENALGPAALSPTPGGRVRRRHLPFTPAAKDVLEGALRQARERGDRRIGDEHVLLSILNRGGLAAGVLAELGVDYETVSALVE